MIIREFIPEDKEECIVVFKSNCPKYFADEELNQFINWLDFQSETNESYKSPTYGNAEKDLFYVMDHPKFGIIGCGGFYVLKEENEARLAWGMIHANYHHKGYGTQLFLYRQQKILKQWPNHLITLGTSQHSYSFYEKMGMKVTARFINGYGEGIDRYDMEKIP